MLFFVKILNGLFDNDKDALRIYLDNERFMRSIR